MDKITQVTIPKGKVIRMTIDATFSERYIVDIINAIITETNTGVGTLTFIVSSDGGIEWKTWGVGVWKIINVDNSDDVKVKGCPFQFF